METEKTPIHEEPLITLEITHDAAVAIGAAAIHFRAWFTGHTEMAPTIAYLDEVYKMIIDQPQLSPVAKETLRDMRLVVAGQRD